MISEEYCELINPSDKRWMEHLKNIKKYDFYHLPKYCELEADWIGGSPCAFLYKNKNISALIPIIIRATPSKKYKDAISPYGYSSPVFTKNITNTEITKIFNKYNLLAKKKNIISSFLRFHPILNNEEMIGLNKKINISFIKRNNTYGVDLKKSSELWLDSLNKNRSRHIKQNTENYNFSIDTKLFFNQFYKIYIETMIRLNAKKKYCYDENYLKKICELKNTNFFIAVLVNRENNVETAALFSNTNDILQYHLSGTSSKYLNKSPLKILLYKMREWAMKNKIKYFHLGGGIIPNDGLSFFKKGFSNYEYSFNTLSIIHNEECFKKELLFGGLTEIDQSKEESFFPLYRK